jgi:serine protease Do
MKTWFQQAWFQQTWKRLQGRVAAPVLAAALVLSLTAYEVAKPAMARAAAAAPAPNLSTSAPLDDNSVSALLALDHAMETLTAHVTPAIVNVAVTAKDKTEMNAQQMPDDMQQFFGQQFGQQFGRQFGKQMHPQQRMEHGIGSGVIISPDGYIVTNNHVVDGAVDIRVTMSDRRILTAKLIGTDPLTDLAVIKIEGKNFPNIPMGNSKDLLPGETVLAFGNPYGFRFTVTRGIISALNRPNPYTDDARKPGQFIQTDAAINPGNSGGPLVNARGEVIGINTFLVSPSGTFSGMGFAIPTHIVKPTVTALIKDGKVAHGYMGIGITDVTPENSKFFEVANNEGAVVTQVEPGSPGAKGGLKVGDVITGLNGQNITDAGSLQVEVGQTSPGTKIDLDVLRDGKKINVPVELEAMGARNGKSAESANADQGKPRWGLGLGDLNDDTRQQIQAPNDVKGAVIENVVPGSVADVKQALSSVPKGQDALVLIWSQGGSTFRVMHASEGA